MKKNNKENNSCDDYTSYTNHANKSMRIDSSNQEYYEELDYEIPPINDRKLSSANGDENTEKFDFRSKLSTTAAQRLACQRSVSFVSNANNEPILDVWKIKPPDFSYKQFEPRPLTVHEKAKLKREQVERCHTNKKTKSAPPVQKLHATKLEEPSYMRKAEVVEFYRKFRSAQPQEARIRALKSDVHPKGTYENPKDHDFRGYLPPSALGLPQFATSYERATSLNFQLEMIKKQLPKTDFSEEIYQFRDVDDAEQIGERKKSAAPKYRPELILPKDQFPTRHEEFTRHRRLNRSVYSAFMEKVQQKLSKKWNDDWIARTNYLNKLQEEEIRRRQTLENRLKRANLYESENSSVS